MDARAHLLSLGWAGSGHSLDSRPALQQTGRRGLAYDPSRDSNTGRGLVKPLLVSQKKNTFGVGKRTYEPAAGNEWWLIGFENALDNIGKRSASEAARSGTATPDTPSGAACGGKHTGLYSFFTKGQEMNGTINEQKIQGLRGQKRKSDTFDDGDHVSSSSGSSTPTRPTAQNKIKSQSDFSLISQFCDIRDKDRKRNQKRGRIDPAEEFAQVGLFFEARAEPKKKPVRKKVSDRSNAISDEDGAIGEELRVERRMRRNDRRIGNASEPLVQPTKEQMREDRKAAKARVKSSSSQRITPADGSEAKSRPTADSTLRSEQRADHKDQKRLAKMPTRC